MCRAAVTAFIGILVLSLTGCGSNGGGPAASGPTRQAAPSEAAFERQLQEQKNRDMMDRAKAMGAEIPAGAQMPEEPKTRFPKKYGGDPLK